MKIVICTSGSRGDVQPYCALGVELTSRGHEVVIATEERMRGLVESFQLSYAHVSGDPTALLWKKEAQVNPCIDILTTVWYRADDCALAPLSLKLWLMHWRRLRCVTARLCN